MSYDALFGLEEEYDVDVDLTYGPGHVKDTSRFRRRYCLVWSRLGAGFGIERVNTEDEAFRDDFGLNLARDASVFDRRQRSRSLSEKWEGPARRGLAGCRQGARRQAMWGIVAAFCPTAVARSSPKDQGFRPGL